MNKYIVLVFIFLCCACEKESEFTRTSDSDHQVDEWKPAKNSNSIFETLLSANLVMFPQQTLTERVEFINSFLNSEKLSKTEISIVIAKNVEADQIVCHEFKLDNPRLGQVIKHTCANLKVCAKALDSTIEIYGCGDK